MTQCFLDQFPFKRKSAHSGTQLADWIIDKLKQLQTVQPD